MDDIIDVRGRLFELEKAQFLEDVLFSIQWWFLILLVIILWTIWVILVDKKRIHAILLIGFMTAMFATVMDDVGLTLSLWAYPRSLSPFVSRLYPVDLAVIPVSYMLLYQYAKGWKPYVIVLVLMMLFAIFIAEPLFDLWHMYIKVKWEYWYSGPIYVAMGLFVKWVVEKVNKVSNSEWRGNIED